jgi:hypothetical protein
MTENAHEKKRLVLLSGRGDEALQSEHAVRGAATGVEGGRW